MQQVSGESRLGLILNWSQTQNATDVHGKAFCPLTVRVNGELNRIPDEITLPLNDQEILQLFAECFTSEVMEDIRNGREIDLSFQFVENRYRANICRQQGYPTFALRIVPNRP